MSSFARGSKKVFIPVLLLFSCIIQSAFSQDLDRKITIHIKNEPLSAALEVISVTGHINFSYNPAKLPLADRVTLKARDESVRRILDELLLPRGIQYFIMEQQVVLKMMSPGEAQAVKPPVKQGRRFTVSGFVKERSTGEALIGANIYAKSEQAGVSTNGYGFYSLTLPEGVDTIVCSFLGFRQELNVISLRKDTLLSMEMEEEKLEMKEVVITSAGQQPGTLQPSADVFTISRKTLSQMPGFAGEADVIRALQAIPGIRSYGDGSSLYFVRGGNYDQNLMLLDETPIYNPAHLFGFFSAISPDAINDIRVYKGDFPAQFGDRLSSVIDIKGREGNMKRFGFSGNIGPYTSSVSLEGPIVRDKSSFFISGRISNLNWINNLIPEGQNFSLFFYDINGKINLRINDRNRLFLTFYTGQDKFDRMNVTSFTTYGNKWDNLAGSLRWNHVFSSRLFSNTTASISRYRYFLYVSPQQEGYWASSIANLAVHSDFTWFANPRNTVRAGIVLSGYQSNPGNVTLEPGSEMEPAPPVSWYQSAEYTIYLSNEQHIGEKVILNYGIRLPVWQDFGPSATYYFDAGYHVIDTVVTGRLTSYDAFFSPEPRISVEYGVSDKITVKAGYTRVTQFLQLLSNSTGPFTSLEVWAPAGPNIPPHVADQLSAGYFQDFTKPGLNLSAEIFYKYYSGNTDYKDHANLLYNPLMEGELRFGTAWAYGIELMVRKPEGKLTGWIGYTWSRSMMKTPDVNDGRVYPANFDSPNEVCINVSYDTRKRWSFTANWIYHTGSPFTEPVGFYYYNGYSVPQYGERNNARLPDYHRLDLSVACRINKPGNRYRHTVILTVYNVYGRMNPFSDGYNRYENGQGDLVVPSDLNGNYLIVPTTLSVAGIIPSINYQFKF